MMPPYKPFQIMYRFFQAIYPLLYTVSLAVYLPVYGWRVLFRGKAAVSFSQRLARLPSLPTEVSRSRAQRIWIHAVSVGEVNVVKPIVQGLRTEGVELYISTTTETGQTLARKLFGEDSRVFYFPLDWRWVIRRFFKAVSPDLVLLAESELWPGFLSVARQEGVPVVIINGRISDRSFSRYKRFSSFVAPLLSQIDHFCVQSAQDKSRILGLGVAKERVNQFGNLKYDYQLAENPEKELLVESLKALLAPAPESSVWVCGSTREGEEEVLIEVFQKLLASSPKLRMILAPRHPHRAYSVASVAQNHGLRALKRSDWQGPEPQNRKDQPAPHILILDSIGELPYVYRMADIVFIGGSLFPTGGQNIIEPASFSKPILFGPHMENFREVSETFLTNYAALRVNNADDLFRKIEDLLKDEKAREWLGRNARKVIRDNKGAVNLTLNLIKAKLKAPVSGRTFSP
jgi:3-deoxy-D-manno-octulosonic-acid transferase